MSTWPTDRAHASVMPHDLQQVRFDTRRYRGRDRGRFVQRWRRRTGGARRRLMLLTAMIGNWEFSNADRDKVCRFVFRPDTAPGGYKVDITTEIAQRSFRRPRTLPAGRSTASARCDCSIKPAMASSNSPRPRTAFSTASSSARGRYVLQSAAAAAPRTAEEFGRRLGNCTRHRQTGLLADAREQSRQRRQLAAESEAGLRGFRCPFRAGVLARRSWRVGLGVGARPRPGGSKKAIRTPGRACRKAPIR